MLLGCFKYLIVLVLPIVQTPYESRHTKEERYLSGVFSLDRLHGQLGTTLCCLHRYRSGFLSIGIDLLDLLVRRQMAGLRKTIKERTHRRVMNRLHKVAGPCHIDCML